MNGTSTTRPTHLNPFYIDQASHRNTNNSDYYDEYWDDEDDEEEELGLLGGPEHPRHRAGHSHHYVSYDPPTIFRRRVFLIVGLSFLLLLVLLSLGGESQGESAVSGKVKNKSNRTRTDSNRTKNGKTKAPVLEEGIKANQNAIDSFGGEGVSEGNHTEKEKQKPTIKPPTQPPKAPASTITANPTTTNAPVTAGNQTLSNLPSPQGESNHSTATASPMPNATNATPTVP